MTSTTRDLESIKIVYEGAGTEAVDMKFKPFTEYFYRVVASNNQGESASEWLLIRTPDASPDFNVDIALLQVAPISGYQIEISQMKRFCVYCEIYKYKAETVFTGIVVKFELLINEVATEQTGNTSDSLTETFTFYCLQSCNVVDDIYSNDSLISILNDPYDSRMDSFLIDVTPITTYSLKVRVCNSYECTMSEG